LFVVIFFGIFCPIFVIIGGYGILFATAIASVIATFIVSNMIIKSNGRVLTFNEIVKYVLCFYIITAMIMAIVAFIIVTGLIGSSPKSFGYYIDVFCGAVNITLLSTLIPMFLVNMYFKNRYRNG
jgi:hypothetical protein